MRAVSLWQPWASCVVLGTKKIETRHWSTKYRGPLAIHAAKRKILLDIVPALQKPAFIEALAPLFGKTNFSPFEMLDALPFGAIVGTVNLVDCVRLSELDVSPIERELGNYGPRRFGWILEDPRAFDQPIKALGRQGFFNVADELLEVPA